jgi:hypothetical protein
MIAPASWLALRARGTLVKSAALGFAVFLNVFLAAELRGLRSVAREGDAADACSLDNADSSSDSRPQPTGVNDCGMQTSFTRIWPGVPQ